jgi:hypothetical protein
LELHVISKVIPTSKPMKDWSIWRTLICFLAAVAAVHALVIAFHLAMLAEWPVGRAFRTFYYSRSPHGVKETWPLIDYYAPTMLLACVTVAFLRHRSIWIYLAGWILCCVTIVGPLPIYSTRLVPTPVATWGTPRPPPFHRLPEKGPFLLMMSVASVIGKYSDKSN